MKAWLKGSLIGLIVGVLYFFISLYDPGCPINDCGLIKKSFLSFTHLIYSATCGNLGGDTAMGCLVFIYPFVNAIIFIIIGGLIGWAIGKIKSPAINSN